MSRIVHDLAPKHRAKGGELVQDPDCDGCETLTFIFGSQVIDEPIAPFTDRVNASRERLEGLRAAKRDRS